MERAWPEAGAGEIPSLDGLRAVSILIVFLSHAGLSRLIPGGFGVTVFFFLSGFLITTLLCREYDRTGQVAFGAFYLRRLLRLLPPLLLTMALAIALALAGLAEGDLSLEAALAQVFFLFNYYQLSPDAETSVIGLDILWSLAVEEHFYLIWPFLFLLIARGYLGSGHVLGLLAAILAWRCVRFLLLGDSEWAIYISTDTRFDSLLYGCLLGILMARGQIPDRFTEPRLLYPVLAVAAAGLLFSFAWRDPGFRSTVRYTLQGIALMPVFFYAVRLSGHPVFRPLNWQVVRRLGVYSYTLYLVHFVILHVLWNMGYPEGGWLTAVYAGALSVAWAAFVNRVAERPLYGIRRRLNPPAAKGA